MCVCCLENCSCASENRRKKPVFCTKPAGHTDTCPDVFLLHSSSFSWSAVSHSLPVQCRLNSLWIATSVVNMVWSLRWLQGVTSQSAYAACLDSCPPGQGLATCLSLRAVFLWSYSISAVLLFKVLLFHFTPSVSGWSFCQPHWELFHSLMHLRITKCCMIIWFKCFLYLVSPFHLPIFHMLSLVAFCLFSNLHPSSPNLNFVVVL